MTRRDRLALAVAFLVFAWALWNAGAWTARLMMDLAYRQTVTPAP